MSQILTCEWGSTEEPEFRGAEILLQALDRSHEAEHGELADVLVAPFLDKCRHALKWTWGCGRQKVVPDKSYWFFLLTHPKLAFLFLRKFWRALSLWRHTNIMFPNRITIHLFSRARLLGMVKWKCRKIIKAKATTFLHSYNFMPRIWSVPSDFQHHHKI